MALECMSGLGFRIGVLGFTGWGLFGEAYGFGSRDLGLESEVVGVGLAFGLGNLCSRTSVAAVSRLGVSVLGVGSRVGCFECRVSSSGFRV